MAQKKKSFPGISIASAQTAFVLCFLMLVLYSYYGGDRYYFIFRQIFFPTSAVFAGMLFARSRVMGKNPEIKLLFGYIAWIGVSVIISTFITNATMDVMYEQTIYATLFASLVCYPLPFLFQTTTDRRRSLALLLHIYLGFYALACALAVVLVLLQANIQPSHTYMMGINPSAGMRLCMFMHPNSVGALSNLSMLLCIYLALDAKNVATKVYCAICALLMYTTIGLADSRTNMIAVAISLGLLAFMLVRRALLAKKPSVGWLVGVGIGILTIAAGYMGFGLINSLIRAAMIRIASAEEAVVLATQSRDYAGHLSTFTGRDIIWKPALKVIFTDPEILLFGTTRERIMDYMSQVPHIAGNLHNSLLQVLMSTGLPGLAMIVGFLYFVIRAAFPLFFSQREGPTLAERFLPVVVFSALVTSLMEAMYFISSGAPMNMLFFLAMGMMVCSARTLRKEPARENSDHRTQAHTLP